MVFSSVTFLFVFLPSLLLIYYLSPKSWRNSVLLSGSLFFYLYGELRYGFVILVSVLGNYIFGVFVDKHRGLPIARLYLNLAIAFNLILLGYFKYLDFFITNINSIVVSWGIPELPNTDITLPIGISFFTFQALSYVIDVYRGQAPVARSLYDLALYICLFPQLIAGPIVRWIDFANQIRKRATSVSEFAYGIRRFILGLGKKVVIANIMGETADDIFALPSNDLSTQLAWFGVSCYALQIYFDFSGYSDMAIGLGRLFGFRFLENFNFPYIAQSMQDFWRRWHISLSTWFRDYLYIPLGGNRCGQWRVYANLLVVFALCGLWHGASWNFVLWGLLHGSFLILERLGLGNIIQRLWRPLRHLYVGLVVLAGWVLFRVDTPEIALDYFRVMLGLGINGFDLQSTHAYFSREACLIFALGLVGCTPILGKAEQYLGRLCSARISRVLLPLFRVAYSAVIFIAAIACLAARTHNPFIYFRF